MGEMTIGAAIPRMPQLAATASTGAGARSEGTGDDAGRSPNLPFDDLGTRVAGAGIGAATYAVQGSVVAGISANTAAKAQMSPALARTPLGKVAPLAAQRARTVRGFALFGAVTGAQNAPKIKERMLGYRSFTNAEPTTLREGIVRGPAQGAALLGGFLGGGTALRYGFASKMMGHTNTHMARYVARKSGPWLATGLGAGAALGAASGAMQTNPSQTWGSMAESTVEPRALRNNYLFGGGAIGGLMGLSAYMASGNTGVAVKAGAKGAAVFGSMFYTFSTIYRMTTTGIQAAGASNKRWQASGE